MTRLHVVHRGPGDGVPVVALHGLTIDHRMMLPLDPVIDAVGRFDRFYVDLPGHGRSEAVTPMTARSVADRVAAAIRPLVGRRRFALVGMSFGAHVATLLTGAFGAQVAGSALLAPAVLRRAERTIPADTVTHADDDLLATLAEDDRAEFCFATAQQDRPRWDLFREFVLPGIRDHDRAAVAELSRSQDGAPWAFPQAHDGQHLIVTGRQDAVVGWADQQRLHDPYPHATSAVLDRCGHNVHLEQPEAVGGLLVAWLQSLPAPDAG